MHKFYSNTYIFNKLASAAPNNIAQEKKIEKLIETYKKSLANLSEDFKRGIITPASFFKTLNDNKQIYKNEALKLTNNPDILKSIESKLDETAYSFANPMNNMSSDPWISYYSNYNEIEKNRKKALSSSKSSEENIALNAKFDYAQLQNTLNTYNQIQNNPNLNKDTTSINYLKEILNTQIPNSLGVQGLSLDDKAKILKNIQAVDPNLVESALPVFMRNMDVVNTNYATSDKWEDKVKSLEESEKIKSILQTYYPKSTFRSPGHFKAYRSIYSPEGKKFLDSDNILVGDTSNADKMDITASGRENKDGSANIVIDYTDANGKRIAVPVVLSKDRYSQWKGIQNNLIRNQLLASAIYENRATNKNVSDDFLNALNQRAERLSQSKHYSANSDKYDFRNNALPQSILNARRNTYSKLPQNNTLNNIITAGKFEGNPNEYNKVNLGGTNIYFDKDGNLGHDVTTLGGQTFKAGTKASDVSKYFNDAYSHINRK